MLAFFSGIGTVELLVILGVALIVLGPAKLPGIAKTLGKGLRDLRRASNDLKRTVYTEMGDVHGTIQEARKAAVDRVEEEARRLADESDVDDDSAGEDAVEAVPEVQPAQTGGAEAPRSEAGDDAGATADR